MPFLYPIHVHEAVHEAVPLPLYGEYKYAHIRVSLLFKTI